MSYVSGAHRHEHSKANALGEEDNAAFKLSCNKTTFVLVSGGGGKRRRTASRKGRQEGAGPLDRE
jgi:hypothetical protein